MVILYFLHVPIQQILFRILPKKFRFHLSHQKLYQLLIYLLIFLYLLSIYIFKLKIQV